MRGTVPRAPEGAPLAGQLRSVVFASGGLRRRFVVYVPARGTGAPMPLVLELHGSTSYPEEQLAISAMTRMADARGFVLVAPEAVDRSWNVPITTGAPDDVGFIGDVVTAVTSSLLIDRARVYATGFSGGGRMVCHLAAALDHPLAAIAPVAGVRFDAVRPPRHAVPVITFHGVNDPVNPFSGGGPAYWQTGVEHAVAAWVEHNQCCGERAEQLSSRVTRSSYGAGGSSVVYYRIDGLGHQWPGSSVELGEPFGPSAAYPDATALIAEFFAAHRLSPSRYERMEASCVAPSSTRS